MKSKFNWCFIKIFLLNLYYKNFIIFDFFVFGLVIVFGAYLAELNLFSISQKCLLNANQKIANSCWYFYLFIDFNEHSLFLFISIMFIFWPNAILIFFAIATKVTHCWHNINKKHLKKSETCFDRKEAYYLNYLVSLVYFFFHILLSF